MGIRITLNFFLLFIALVLVYATIHLCIVAEFLCVVYIYSLTHQCRTEFFAARLIHIYNWLESLASTRNRFTNIRSALNITVLLLLLTHNVKEKLATQGKRHPTM